LVEPRNSLLRQYKKIFSLEGIQMELTDEAVQAVASLALKKGTGARGLRTILEKTMLDLMYEMPSKKGEVAKIVINADVVNGIRLPLIFGKNDEEVA
jgi:ATP-dependent Clp protease ATP-binding subunit ClpX